MPTSASNSPYDALRLKKNVYLLGDSTLDNFRWVNETQYLTVAGYLETELGNDYHITDLSCDGFTTSDIQTGAYRDKSVQTKNHTHVFYEPLKILPEKANTDDHMVVSVGGNDIRELLEALFLSPATIRPLVLEHAIKGIQKRYLQILQELQSRGFKNITLMTQYTPDASCDLYGVYMLMSFLRNSTSLPSALLQTALKERNIQKRIYGNGNPRDVQVLHDIMEQVYKPVLEYARTNGLAIVDMASSLDYTNTNMYESQIEPSSFGSEHIARVLSHSIKQHDFDGPSKIYFQRDRTKPIRSILTDENTWRPRPRFPETEAEAKQIFLSKYQERLAADRSRLLGLFSTYIECQLDTPHMLPLDQLIDRALGKSGKSKDERSLSVMRELGWIGKKNRVLIQFDSTEDDDEKDVRSAYPGAYSG